MMIKNIIPALLAVLLIVSCSADTSFSISQTQVGPITKTTTVGELETLFAKDSIEDYNTRSQYKNTASGITIFEKGGKKLMRVLPKDKEDKSLIENIQIFDNRYQTEKGISLNSTFKDINQAYTIKRIDNLLNAIVIFVNESDAYFTIDKKHLASDLMFDTRAKIDKTQIPDDTPLKYFMIGW